MRDDDGLPYEDFLQDAEASLAFAKAGFYGEAGAGKTYTATKVAIGLALLDDPPAPIAFFDTEGGSHFMRRMCRDAGVRLQVAKARSFERLMRFMELIEARGAVGIIDSISHPWEDLLRSYAKKLGREDGFEFQDWGVIKPAWAEFTAKFLTCECHVIVCGRAAPVWEYVYNKARDKMELQSHGSRMKTEKETSYEPSLLVEMVRRVRRDDRGKPKGFDRVAIVMKDRSDQMDGAEIVNPTFDSFRPHFDDLDLGGSHNPTDTVSDSQDMFDRPENPANRRIEREIELDKIKAVMAKADINSRSVAGKREMIGLLEMCWGTSSWKEIEKRVTLELLRAGREKLEDHLAGFGAD